MRTRPQHLLLAATLTLTAAGLPIFGSQAAATDRVVVVRAGQTLSEIAVQHGVSIERLVRLNRLSDPNRIYAGQRLIVGRPKDVVRSSPKATAAKVTHRVSYGETLWSIAARYRSSVTAIVNANGIANPSFIRVGQVLTIPGASSAPAPSGNAGRRPGTAHGGMSPAMAAAVAARQEIARLIVREARRQGVPAAFALAVAWQESGWQARAVSYAGAIGVMQLLPSTAEWVGQTMLGRSVNVWDPASNVQAGVRLLKHYLDRYGGNRSLALAAYYQGQTAADRHGIYAVSRPYISSILALERLFSR